MANLDTFTLLCNSFLVKVSLNLQNYQFKIYSNDYIFKKQKAPHQRKHQKSGT